MKKIPTEMPTVECPEPVEGRFYVYLLICKDKSFYCGSTANLRNRINEHNSGEAANWTKTRRPIRLVYFEEYNNLTSARRRERQIKGWTIHKKLNLVNGTWEKLEK